MSVHIGTNTCRRGPLTGCPGINLLKIVWILLDSDSGSNNLRHGPLTRDRENGWLKAES